MIYWHFAASLHNVRVPGSSIKGLWNNPSLKAHSWNMLLCWLVR